MTWSLSVTMIALVLRPCVASISLPLSPASSRILLIGDEPGAMIAITREADTTLPNPILTSGKPRFDFFTVSPYIDVCRATNLSFEILNLKFTWNLDFDICYFLLQVLYLFLDLFKLVFHLYNTVEDLYVLRLGADSVYLSAQFLDHKVKFFPYRII